MAKRSALLSFAIVVGAVAIAGWWLLLQGPEAIDAPVTVRSATARTNAPASAPNAPPPATGVSSLLAVERTAEIAPAWNDGTHDVVGPIVEGTFVVVDRDEKKHEVEDGSFVPDFVDGVDSDSESEPVRLPVAVNQGRFRFDARGATAMVVDELELGGHAAVVDGGVDLSTGQPLELKARWIDDVLLHVVDATAREELLGVRVCFGGRLVPFAEHPGCPGPPSVLFDVERSPLHLTRATSIDRVVMDGAIWIGARDHAWKRETIDFGRERVHEVALGPGGALAVVVTEPVEAPPIDRRRPPRVRLRHPDRQTGDPICDVDAKPGSFELEGLEPGEVIAAIEIGDSHLSPVILSRESVTIRAGATARVTLNLDPKLAPKPTILAGTAYVPPAWGTGGMWIDLVPLDLRGGVRDDEQRQRTIICWRSIAGRPGWHEWDFGSTLPATYRLSVKRAGFETEVEVDEAGRDDVTLTLPEPAVLHVRVVDAESLQDVEVGGVSWIPVGLRSPFGEELQFDRATSRWIGAVLPGEGRLLGSSERHDDAVNRFTVVAGTNELVLHSPPACGVILRIVRKTEEKKFFEVTWSSEAGPPGHDDAGFAWIRENETSHRIVLPEPGHYRFSSARGAKDASGLLFEVDVARGEFVEQTITLGR